jgi:hypothetical protein
MLYLTCLVVASLVQQERGQSEADALAHALHDGFASNQSSFPFGQISFVYIRGIAKGDVSARSGDFGSSYTASCLYNYNGTTARYERIFRDEDMRAANKKVGNEITSIIDTFRMATNGECTLYDSIAIAEKVKSRGTKLSPGARDFDRDFQFPLSLGRPLVGGFYNLGKSLQGALQGEPGRRIKTVEAHFKYEGRDVVRVVLTTTTGEVEYYVDTERGAVPLKIVDRESASDRLAAQQVIHYLDDLRLIPGHGWLPFKQSWWYSVDGRGYQIVLGEANFESPPGESAFALDFPKAISLVDAAKGIRYPPNRTWNVLRLPRTDSSGVEKVEYSSIPDDAVPKLPGEMPARSGYSLLILGAAAAALAVGTMIWRRR